MFLVQYVFRFLKWGSQTTRASRGGIVIENGNVGLKVATKKYYYY